MLAFHLIFSESLHFAGASPRAMPVSKGPRQRGQSPSVAAGLANTPLHAIPARTVNIIQVSM
jgi:hypothetical protein